MDPDGLSGASSRESERSTSLAARSEPSRESTIVLPRSRTRREEAHRAIALLVVARALSARPHKITEPTDASLTLAFPAARDAS